MQEDDARGIYR
jgi:serine/threonine protein kinase